MKINLIENINNFKSFRLGVALSGGRDSIALCYALKQGLFDFFAINIEHGIRGENSKRDTKFVKEFCDNLGIELKMISVDVPTFAKENGYTMEQGARILRYRVFDELIETRECDYIALGHHQDDQVETILMRVLRGTGLNGLKGMKFESGRYLRPFLNITRKEIDEYILSHDLSYVEDETNQDTKYTRNLIRKEISILKNSLPNLSKSVLRLSQIAGEADDFILSHAISPIINSDGEVEIEIGNELEPVVFKKSIILACNMLGAVQDIEQRHLDIIVQLVNNTNSKRVSISNGIVVHKQDEKLIFLKEEETKSQKIEIYFNQTDKLIENGIDLKLIAQTTNEVQEYLKNGINSNVKSQDKFKRTLFVCGDLFTDDFVFRRRQDGDIFEKFGGGKKSLSDYLTDIKIPLRKRDGLIVLAKCNEVYAILGVEISKKLRVREDTSKIYELKLSR